MSAADDPSEPALETIFYRVERVPFVYWGRFSSAKATVFLIGLITILTFISGLSTLSQEEVTPTGPLAQAIPELTEVIRFGGVIAAFLLAIIVFGLNRSKRLSWYAALIVLPFVGMIPLFTFESTQMPLLLLTLIAIPMLVLNREQFTATLDLTSLQIASISSIVGVIAYGMIGSYAIRDQFTDLETWSDALYFVLVTIATVGFGDITPNTAEAKWFTLSVIIFGVGAFTTAIGALIVPAIEKRMASAFGNMTPSTLALLEDHVIVLGYGAITDAVLDVLADESEVVVITDNVSVASDLDDAEINVLTADPTDVETIRDAGAEFARGAIAATDDDARDVLAVLAARKANQDLKIVAAANAPHHVEKFRDVGADVVISPTTISGILLGQSVMGEGHFDGRLLDELGIDLTDTTDESSAKDVKSQQG